MRSQPTDCQGGCQKSCQSSAEGSRIERLNRVLAESLCREPARAQGGAEGSGSTRAGILRLEEGSSQALLLV
eukprot:15462353-Alexandrium_andersonii.AAC.1